MYQEYESCSSLFMSEGGTFAIMVDSNHLTSQETIEATYNCRVGSYIDRILDSTSAGENKPKIQLVVTKVTPATDKDALFGILFEMTRKHLESKQGDSAYLVDRVMKSPHKDHLMHVAFIKAAVSMAFFDWTHPIPKVVQAEPLETRTVKRT